MGGRNETDVVTAAMLEFEHHLGQPLVRDLVLFLLLPCLRDLIVLAVNTAEVAVAEKNVPGAVRAAQNRFFAEMRREGRDDRQLTGIARGDFVVQTVVPAILRADRA